MEKYHRFFGKFFILEPLDTLHILPMQHSRYARIQWREESGGETKHFSILSPPCLRSTSRRKWFILELLLIIFGSLARLLPHPMNFTPVGAITLFGGIYLPKRFALFVPIGAMYVSDMFIGFYDAKIMLAVYGSFILTGIMGFSIRKRKNVATIIGGTLAGSLLFFLITNAAVWAFGDMYAHTLAGLEESYIAALPFFRNSALGDIFYTGMLVGSFEGMRYILVTLKRRRAPASAHPFFG